MVFEESTFVLPKAAAKVAPEPFEPAVQDPRAKSKTVDAAAPAATIKAPTIGKLQMFSTKICLVHVFGCFGGKFVTYRSRCSARQQNVRVHHRDTWPRVEKDTLPIHLETGDSE